MSAAWQWLVVVPLLMASGACAIWMLCPAALRMRLARRLGLQVKPSHPDCAACKDHR
ncbi:MAG: hypothetical protein ACO38Y_04740 [Steroidobacteraceae bacterium]